MRKHNGPITKDVILQYIPEDIASYSLWMPGDSTTAAIQCTRVFPGAVQTFYETVELDDVFVACVEYLSRSGAPAFKDAKEQDRYAAALEEQLRQGFSRREARDAALRVVNSTTSPISPDNTLSKSRGALDVSK